MMDQENLVTNLCSCLEILTSENKAGDDLAVKNSSDAFAEYLENNLNCAIQTILAHVELSHLLNVYVQNYLNESDACIHWRFVVLCALLVKVLNDLLLSEDEKSIACNINVQTASLPPKGILSITQEKTVKKTLQFIIALGVLPNLVPGIGIPLQNRSEYGTSIKNNSTDICPQRKYYQLVFCLEIILKCLKQKVLQSIILSYHAGDLLTMLIQVCYAPIKKVNVNKAESSEYFDEKQSLINLRSEMADLKQKDLCSMLTDVKDCPSYPNERVTEEMQKDRIYFTLQLKRLLSQISPFILDWQLLLLQGIPIKQEAQQGRRKIPLWFQKVCNQLLTEQILMPGGLKIFIQSILDNISDDDMKTGVDKAKVDAIAKLISHNPAKYMSFESYLQEISKQVIDLMHAKDAKSSLIFTSIASCIILHFYEINSQLTEVYIFMSLFQPLYSCFKDSESKDHDESYAVANEKELSTCIEDAHEVFVMNSSLTSERALRSLLPFYHLIFCVFMKLQNSVSYLRNKVKDLLVTVLNKISIDESISLLQLLTFEDDTFPPVKLAENLKCEFGDSGGIVISKCSSGPEDIMEKVVLRCQAISALLLELPKNKIKVKYFLFLLKKVIHILNETESDVLERKNDDTFITLFMALQILEDLSELVTEDLISDLNEVVSIIKIACEHGINTSFGDNQSFGHQTMMMCLVILNTLTGYHSELTSDQWKIMKSCLPGLEKLESNIEDPFIKNMIVEVRTAISTHGAASTFSKNPPENAQKFDYMNFESHSEKLNVHSFKSYVDNNKFEFQKSSSNKVSKTDTFEDSKELTEQLTLPTNSESAKNEKCKNYANSSDRTKEVVKYSYETAMKDLKDSILPVKGHGLIMLCRLLEQKDKETLAHKEELLDIFQEHIENEDSYIYLPSIQGLSLLADTLAESVLNILSKFQNFSSHNIELQLKIGEVLLKVCKNLGEMTTKYRTELLNAYLCGTRHCSYEVRASSLSNLGEVCKKLKFALGPWLQEILICIKALLKTDPSIEVRRAAALVTTLLLQGTGKETFLILKDEIKELYSLLREKYAIEKDDILKLHLQLALEEINIIVKESISNKSCMTKEIRVLDPF